MICFRCILVIFSISSHLSLISIKFMCFRLLCALITCIIVGDQEAQISWMEHCSSRRAKLQENLDAMELKQVWNNENVGAICCSTVVTAMIGATINEISCVK